MRKGKMQRIDPMFFDMYIVYSSWNKRLILNVLRETNIMCEFKDTDIYTCIVWETI